MAELCLGTAQLGMQYGINNRVGKPNKDVVFDILDTALMNGIKLIDTASIYGEAEQIIGEYLSGCEASDSIKVISKQCNSIKGLSKEDIEKTIRQELSDSLLRLKREYVDGYLLHALREIDNIEALEVLHKLKDEGLISKIGVSVYEIDEAEKAINEGYVDYLQMPCSIFDQRGLKTGIFRKAKERGITVCTRSAFLQGLLMMKGDEIPCYLQEIIPYLNKFEELLTKYGLNRRHAIIKYILSKSSIDYMVFGVETKEQLEEILRERDTEDLPEEYIMEVEREFDSIPTRLILPIHWKN